MEEKRSPILSVRLGPNTKERWEAHCANLGKAPSTAIKEAIEQALTKADRTPSKKHFKQTKEAQNNEPKIRFEVLLTRSEKDALALRAEQESCSQRRWVIDAIRVGLTSEPQFGMKEIEALGESNYQLLAVGRNLNQIARRLNEGKREPIFVKALERLSAKIDAHTELVSAAMRASIERWDIE